MSWYLLTTGQPRYALDGSSLAAVLLSRGALVLAEGDVQAALDAWHTDSPPPEGYPADWVTQAELDAELAAFEGGTGTEGPQGPPGVDGQDGADGAQGPPGVDGIDGTDGAQGPPGADGADGAQGPPGADGQDGLDGAPGADAGVVWIFKDETAGTWPDSGARPATANRIAWVGSDPGAAGEIDGDLRLKPLAE